MKKTFASLGLISLIAAFSGTASAQNTSSTLMNATSTASVSAAAPAAVCLTLTGNLHSGMSNSAGVLALQNFLSAQGYFSAALNGNFGPITLQAVKDYQSENAIPSTGYVGPLTRASIREATCSDTAAPLALSLLSASSTSSSTAPTEQVAAPTLHSIDPGHAFIGQNVKLAGKYFTDKTYVLLNGAYAAGPIYSPDGTSLSFAVPGSIGSTCDVFSATNSCPPESSLLDIGTYLIQVETANGISNVGRISLLGQGAAAPDGAGLNYPTNTPYPTDTGASVFSAPATPPAPAVAGTQSLATPPSISSLSTQKEGSGASVTIYGSGFTPDGNAIYFGNTALSEKVKFSSADGKTLTFAVPPSSYACPSNALCQHIYSPIPAGNYLIYVTNANGTSNSMPFTITGTTNASANNAAGAPTISLISPLSGAPGTVVTVSGSGFSSTGNIVMFDGAHAPRADSVYDSPDRRTITFAIPSKRGDNCTAFSCTNVIYQPYGSGTYTVMVSNAAGTSNAASFSLTGGSGLSGKDQ